MVNCAISNLRFKTVTVSFYKYFLKYIFYTITETWYSNILWSKTVRIEIKERARRNNNRYSYRRL